MALTTAEQLALFEILDVPFADGTNAAGYNTLDGMAALATSTLLSSASQSQAVTAINNWIANMIAGTQTDLKAILDRWIVLGTSRVRVEAGNVGDLTGVTYSPDEERAIIRERVKIRVPFYKYHEVIARAQGASANGINLVATR